MGINITKVFKCWLWTETQSARTTNTPSCHHLLAIRAVSHKSVYYKYSKTTSYIYAKATGHREKNADLLKLPFILNKHPDDTGEFDT